MEETLSISNAWLPVLKNVRMWGDRQGELSGSPLRILSECREDPLGNECHVETLSTQLSN